MISIFVGCPAKQDAERFAEKMSNWAKDKREGIMHGVTSEGCSFLRQHIKPMS